MNGKLQQHANEKARQFVEDVSHEFRTPLTVIKEFASLVRDQAAGPLTEQQARYLDTVVHRTEDLARLVDDILDVSRLNAGLLRVDRRSHRLGEVLDQVVSIIERRAATKNLKLVKDIPADLPRVFCDEEKVRRVVLNLAVNALKFTPESGCVTLWARPDPDGFFVRVGVTDTGTGISQQDQMRIFRRFHQAHGSAARSSKGFGLGLDIARELAQVNLGSLDLQSEAGRGSTFSFTLPMDDPETVAQAFLSHIGLHSDQCMEVALLELKALDVMSQETPDVQDFLADNIGCSDLLYRRESGSWRMFTTRPTRQVDELRTSLEAARCEFNRNAPIDRLPPLAITLLRRGVVPDDNEEMIKRFCGPNYRTTSVPRQVLIVDDDDEIAEALGVRLRGAGYRVVTAHDGQAGIESAVLHRPDAVLMDIRMPVKDGMTALSEMRSRADTRDLPIIMLSASVRDRQAALEQGARFFIQKPYDPQMVMSALEASMGSNRPETNERMRKRNKGGMKKRGKARIGSGT